MASSARRPYSGRSRQRSSSIAVLGEDAAAACASSSLSTAIPGLSTAAEGFGVLDRRRRRRVVQHQSDGLGQQIAAPDTDSTALRGRRVPAVRAGFGSARPSQRTLLSVAAGMPTRAARLSASISR